MLGRRKRQKEMIVNNFGDNPLESISYYNAKDRLDDVERLHNSLKRCNNHTEDLVDDVTWEDLEMDDVFLRINHTNSFIGEQVLYHKLHDLHNHSENHYYENMEQRMIELEEHPNHRIEMEAKLNDIGKREDAYYLSEVLENTDMCNIGNSLILHSLQILLAVFLVLSIFTGKDIFVLGMIVVAITNLTIYIRTKTKYEVYLNSLVVFKQIYDFAKWMEKQSGNMELWVPKEVRNAIQSLKNISKVILNVNGRKQNTFTGDVFAIAYDYIWGVTLLDVAVFRYILKVIHNKQDEVLVLLEYAGEMDSEIAIMSYRASRKEWSVPEFVEAGIEAKGLAHPLLEHPVKSDFALSDRAIITGTNASGKSTFMKAVAINGILAQTIHTCTAEQIKLGRMYVMTCMSLRDDVLSGESYYFREAKYLKRMLDKVENKDMVLCVIDEILKGTNTKERIAASKAILDYFGKSDCLTLVATHDNELTENALYKNYHFESSIIDNDIHFDYQIRDGVSKESNAIALLSLLGYPEDIVKQARENVG